jgi:hypothetical protein
MTTRTANSTVLDLDSDLAYTLRNLRNNIGNDEAVLAWLRADYARTLSLAVERGYGTTASLNAEAKRLANHRHPYVGTRPESLAPAIVRGLRIRAGLEASLAEHESEDLRLAD